MMIALIWGDNVDDNKDDTIVNDHGLKPTKDNNNDVDNENGAIVHELKPATPPRVKRSRRNADLVTMEEGASWMARQNRPIYQSTPHRPLLESFVETSEF